LNRYEYIGRHSSAREQDTSSPREQEGQRDSLLGVVARNAANSPLLHHVDAKTFYTAPAGNDGFQEVSQAKMLRSFIKKRSVSLPIKVNVLGALFAWLSNVKGRRLNRLSSSLAELCAKIEFYCQNNYSCIQF
jgi:hypothetical protein